MDTIRRRLDNAGIARGRWHEERIGRRYGLERVEGPVESRMEHAGEWGGELDERGELMVR